MFVTTDTAEETQDANPIGVPIDSDKWVEGALKENIEGQAKVRYRGFEGGSSHGPGGFMFCYGEGNTVAPTDISGKKVRSQNWRSVTVARSVP